MKHFPIFINLVGQRVVVAGVGETAVAKLRLILKTAAQVHVFGAAPTGVIVDWAKSGRLSLTEREVGPADMVGTTLVYAALDNPEADARVAQLGRAAGALVNVVDNLQDSDFITPAIVDRNPVTVAIGTEGTAPVLARQIKAQIEEALPQSLGVLARLGQSFRSAAEVLPVGRPRRDFWSRFYFERGPLALAEGGENAARGELDVLLDQSRAEKPTLGRVDLVGAGPGDPELMTLRARKLLHAADVVIHDQLVSRSILELARREAIVVETGKRGFGESWAQEDINELMIRHAHNGHHVVRLKSGDPVVFARLDAEMDALDAAGIAWTIVPGITAASAAAAQAKVSLTSRGRNSNLRFLTAHDVDGFADQDWRELAKPDAVAAIYMGKRAAAFLRGRLLMFGAAPTTPVTIVENASRLDQRILQATLLTLPDILGASEVNGPAVMLLGLAPRVAAQAAFEIEIDHMEHA
jgi:uroporphyrin-III C-methyltransferase/precorrin-2 dehydrogenase/sirohydrochlorin ferrochelatase